MELLEATKHRQDTQEDQIKTIEVRLAAFDDLFTHKDGTDLTNAQAIARLDHRLNMMAGEFMSIIGEMHDLRDEIRTTRYLITGAGRWGVRHPRKAPATDGASPLGTDAEQ
jgi:hypothetical protein|tara:strand:- start:1443 stop:1775 length:333 start_codon:yes stop_codon:yes gene_type:complete